MKSSLLTLTLVSSLVLSGCFKNSSHDGCSSCSDEVATEQMGCATCPSSDILPESAIIVEEEMGPEMDNLEEVIVEEK